VSNNNTMRLVLTSVWVLAVRSVQQFKQQFDITEYDEEDELACLLPEVDALLAQHDVVFVSLWYEDSVTVSHSCPPVEYFVHMLEGGHPLCDVLEVIKHLGQAQQTTILHGIIEALLNEQRLRD
jgi:hypothetical protein